MGVQTDLKHSQVDKSLSWDQVYTNQKKKAGHFQIYQNIFKVNLSSNTRREVVYMVMWLFSFLKRTK